MILIYIIIDMFLAATDALHIFIQSVFGSVDKSKKRDTN